MLQMKRVLDRTLACILVVSTMLFMAHCSGVVSRAEEETGTETDLSRLSLSAAASPDGTKIVFAVRQKFDKPKPIVKTSIYWMNTGGGKPVFVAEVSHGSIPFWQHGWSHDSRMFAFTTVGTLGVPLQDEHDSLKNCKIKIFDTTTSALKTVIPPNGLTFMPVAFSPVTNELIALFVRDVDSFAGCYLHLYNLQDGSSKELTPDRLFRAYSWVWGSDGREIYYCVERDGACIVRAVNISTLAVRDVIRLNGDVEQLCSLPDGKSFCLLDSSGSITLFTGEGEILRRIESGSTLPRVEFISWFDNERVAFLAGSDGTCKDGTKHDLIVSEDGLNSYRVIARELVSYSFDWISAQTLMYAEGQRIVLISSTGEHLRTLFSLDDQGREKRKSIIGVRP